MVGRGGAIRGTPHLHKLSAVDVVSVEVAAPPSGAQTACHDRCIRTCRRRLTRVSPCLSTASLMKRLCAQVVPLLQEPPCTATGLTSMNEVLPRLTISDEMDAPTSIRPSARMAWLMELISVMLWLFSISTVTCSADEPVNSWLPPAKHRLGPTQRGTCGLFASIRVAACSSTSGAEGSHSAEANSWIAAS